MSEPSMSEWENSKEKKGVEQLISVVAGRARMNEIRKTLCPPCGGELSEGVCAYCGKTL